MLTNSTHNRIERLKARRRGLATSLTPENGLAELTKMYNRATPENQRVILEAAELWSRPVKPPTKRELARKAKREAEAKEDKQEAYACMEVNTKLWRCLLGFGPAVGEVATTYDALYLCARILVGAVRIKGTTRAQNLRFAQAQRKKAERLLMKLGVDKANN